MAGVRTKEPDDGEKGQAKHEEGVLVHEVAVPHADTVHVGRGPELFALKCRHRGSISVVICWSVGPMGSEGRIGSSVF